MVHNQDHARGGGEKGEKCAKEEGGRNSVRPPPSCTTKQSDKQSKEK